MIGTLQFLHVKRTHALKVVLLAIMLIAVPATTSCQSSGQDVTGVLGAMPVEVQPLIERLQDVRRRSIQGIPFTLGTLEGAEVVIAETGVGKVNAAITATLLLEHFEPNRVFFSGIAGSLSPDLAPGDVVVGQRAAQHDLGTLTSDGINNWGPRPPADTTQNPVFFPADPSLLDVAMRTAEHLELTSATPGHGSPRVVAGTVLTGDVFVASESKKAELRTELDGDAIEMEGAAVAQVCWQFGRVPLILIRGISDAADESAYGSAAEFRGVAARNAASVTIALVVANAGARE